MRYLTLYKPTKPSEGAPDPAHIAKMGTFMEEMMKAGTLIATGGVLRRASTGMRAALADGRFSVQDNPPGPSVLLDAAGWAILEAPTKAALLDNVERFLRLAGEGTSEIIQIMDPPPG